MEFFSKLLKYKEEVDAAIDEIMYKVALERKNDSADIHIAEVVKELDLDEDRIMSLVDEVEEES